MTDLLEEIYRGWGNKHGYSREAGPFRLNVYWWSISPTGKDSNGCYYCTHQEFEVIFKEYILNI